MKSFIAVAIASTYGLSIRLLFGVLNGFMGIMSTAFLVVVPFIVGYLTVILVPKEKKINAAGAFFLPWLTGLILLIITILLNIEGAICWVMVYPFFAALAGIGGITAYLIRERNAKKRNGSGNVNENDFGNPNTLKISALFLIPVFAGFIEGDKGSGPQELYLKKEVIIQASADKVWKTLISNKTSDGKKQSTAANVLGFPKHLKTIIGSAVVGGKRIAVYEKGLYFLETISKCEPSHLLVLQIKTDPDKIPPTVMDEHILIGGKHLKILEDVYKLKSLPGGKTRLSLSSHFYINTPFNWYAGIWANYLMADILQGELDLINRDVSTQVNNK